MSVVTAATVVTTATVAAGRVDPASVDLVGTHAVDITAWMAAATAQAPAA